MFNLKKKKSSQDTHPLSAVESGVAKKSWWKLGARPNVKKNSAWAATSKPQEQTKTVKTVSRTTTQGNTEWESKKFKELPLIGKWEQKKQYTLGGSLFAVGLIIGAFGFFANQNATDQVKSMQKEGFALKASAETMGRGLERFVNGKSDSFEMIAKARADLEASLKMLSNETKNENAKEIIIKIQADWDKSAGVVTGLTGNKQGFEEFISLNNKFKDVQAEAAIDLRKFIEVASKKEADERTRQRIQDGLRYLQNIDKNVLISATTDEPTPDASFKITKGITAVKKYMEDMERGNEVIGVNKITDVTAKAKFEKFKDTFNKKYLEPVTAISASGLSVQAMKEGASKASVESTLLIQTIDNLVKVYEAERDVVTGFLIVGWLGVFVLAFGLFLLDAIKRKGDKKQELESRATLARNNQAVMQLLNELDPIRDGDLTKKLTVLDQFTATIADAMNATTEDLSSLVKGVQNASLKLSSASQNMEIYSKKSAELSGHQLTVVKGAAESVTNVGNKLNALAQSAEDTASMASRSQTITEEGGKTIQKALSGIQNIQVKISETKDRVSRLKDTSGQIADILSTIRDIAEKTNVLAINANIEASRAGAAGKGFTVVAKSVQDLAQQASEATRKIGALIDSVQSDIEGATKSMNETASEMTETTRSSEMSGEAFIEIEEATYQLSEAIEEMRQQTLRQADESSTIHQQMQEMVGVVEEVSRANASVQESASEVSKLSEVLSDSTQRFKVI